MDSNTTNEVENIDISATILNTIKNTVGVEYSKEQKAILEHIGGMCILASAGSGKTTLITHLVAKRIRTHEIQNTDTLLCTTYSKGGAEELEQRLDKLLKSIGLRKTVYVKTMHAMYLGILKYFGYPSDVIDPRDRTKYIIEACREIEINLDEEDFQALDSLLSYQVNNLLSDADLVQSYAYTLDNVSLEEYSEIRKKYAGKKIQAKVIDFDDMQLYVYSLLYQQGRQDIVDYCRAKWTDIYIDEAQDMSRIQYIILKKIITDPQKLVMIGDDDQCIYQWRGADPSILLNICADYDISRFVLSTNYRCAGEIVKLAAEGIKHNSKRSDKEMKPYINGGDIKVCDCGSSNLYTMSKYAYKHIKKLVLEEEITPSQIAVLSRNNSHLCILSNMLFKDGIHCETTNDMKLTRSATYRSIRDILDVASDGYNAKLTENTLNKICLYLKKADAKRIGQIQGSMGANLSSVLGYMATKYWKRQDINWTPNVKVPGLAEAKIAQPLSYLGNETVENLVLIYKLLSDTDTVKRATGLLALYLTATEYQYRDKQDKKRTVEGLVDYIIDLIKTMGFNEAKQFLRVAEQYEEGRMAVPGAKVCMSTMHGAKGKEWRNVILFADDNVAFPSFSGIVHQLKTGVAMSDVFYGIDENRRLHYVAMTRAKKELAIFTDSKNIGLYLLESMGIFDYGVGNNAHIVSMATEGMVYPDLIDKSNVAIFGEKSIYNYKLDISDISGTIEIDYLYRGNDKKTSVSLDNIITATPQTLVD